MKNGRSFSAQAFFRHSRIVLLPLLLFALGCSVSFWFASLQYRSDIGRMREHLSAQLDEIRGNLSRELYAALYLTEGIRSLVVTEKAVDEGQFQSMARELLSHNPIIRNVALAPGNVVRYVFPYEGNAGIIGLRYLDVPNQRASVVRAMLEKKMVVAGPVALVQGGVGIIGRTPIYINGPGDVEAGQGYWGLLSTVIDFPRLIQATGLEPSVPETNPPMTGPTPAAKATTDVMVPNTLPRSSAGK